MNSHNLSDSMFSKAASIFSMLFFLSFYAHSQNCTLDIGGKNSETIVKLFQLNPDQITKLEEFRQTLQDEILIIDNEIQNLFDTHPQSTQEELIALAEKYKVLQKKVVDASLEGDKKLLSTFNQKQYQRYVGLCNEALRDPIIITPVVIEEVVDPE